MRRLPLGSASSSFPSVVNCPVRLSVEGSEDGGPGGRKAGASRRHTPEGKTPDAQTAPAAA
jgi:hypothetical protein